ncbi:hypothetical protein [Sulfurospirillum arcachonense]|uniref:hypothetical protein n=1 Tax=Sulfurospirillum arcachonense TaxID=57666 RepID=UPI0004B03004|nr:hypothetical protein [Sulfurospirillum arcachonense]
MHELKTPIAKGKIVSALIEDEVQKERIFTIFDKLNFVSMILQKLSKLYQVIVK